MEYFIPIAIVALFYFILLRPILRAQKKHKENVAELKVGDEVLTSGGFYAVVKSIQTQDTGPSSIIFELASGIEVEGTAIAIDTVNPRGSTLQPLNKVDGPEA
ncbi:MAG: preprotein translocase subunit YajC [Dehalococcoidia bacterium]|nr:preprotein translocase subunit YajC [Dehalococcoidia bacterium]